MSMTKQDWESLSSCPGWSAMRRYLMDYRASLAEAMAEGNVPGAEFDRTVVRCQTAKDLAEMDWPTIAKFYGLPLEETKQ